jgi:putative ABC transport system substrate-binding protein
MRRREFITLVGSAVAAWPLSAFGKTQRIAIVSDSFPVERMTDTSGDPLFQALFNEFRHLGYVEGQSILIDRYSGGGRASHNADLARDVVSRNPDVIVTVGNNNLTLDFKAATTTIPIVGLFASPVEFGIVASLARPGGNITGFSIDVEPEVWGRRVQLLQQVVPQATELGFLQTRLAREQWGPKEEASGLPVKWGDYKVTWVGPPLNHPIDEAEYRRVFAALIQDHAAGLVVGEEDVNIANLKLVIELAEERRLPAIYPFKMFVQAGGLMSYGNDVSAFGHDFADMVVQILKGTKPADIPIRQPTKFELAVNLKTAKALGLTVPPELLTSADEVIE